jgi:hypothetical protein
MFRAVVERAGVADQFEIDSCGTGGGAPDWYLPGGYSYHEGDAADRRMTKAGGWGGGGVKVVCVLGHSVLLVACHWPHLRYPK